MNNIVFNKICELLINDYNNWNYTLHKHTFRHKSGITIWTSNGIFFLSINYPEEIGLSFMQKIKLYKYIKKCKEKKILELIDKLCNQSIR